MVFLFKTVLQLIFTLWLFGFYLAHCDSNYTDLCQNRTHKCAGYAVGEIVSDVKRGYRNALIDDEQLVTLDRQEAINNLKKNK